MRGARVGTGKPGTSRVALPLDVARCSHINSWTHLVWGPSSPFVVPCVCRSTPASMCRASAGVSVRSALGSSPSPPLVIVSVFAATSWVWPGRRVRVLRVGAARRLLLAALPLQHRRLVWSWCALPLPPLSILVACSFGVGCSSARHRHAFHSCVQRCAGALLGVVVAPPLVLGQRPLAGRY